MSKIEEIFLPVPNYEGLYEISNFGRVRSLPKTCGCLILKGKFLRQTLNDKGYFRVCLYKDGRRSTCRVHRLVAQVFIPNPDNKPHINHIDASKINNNYSNLEWCTPLENSQHADKMGLVQHGEVHHNSILKTENVVFIKQCLDNKTHNTVELSKMFGVNRTTISDIKNNKKWKHLV